MVKKRSKEYVPVECIVNAGSAGGRCYANWPGRNHPQCVEAHAASLLAAEQTPAQRAAARAEMSADRSAKRIRDGQVAGKMGPETRQGYGPGPAAT